MIITFSRIKFPAKMASLTMRNTLFHHARVTVERTSEYRSAKGCGKRMGRERERNGRGGCGKCNRSADASAGVSKRVVGTFCASRETRENRYRTSPSSCSRSSLHPPRPYSCHLRHPPWTSDRSHPRRLPSRAQSRATTEIRLAIIVDDKVEQCRTPAS